MSNKNPLLHYDYLLFYKHNTTAKTRMLQLRTVRIINKQKSCDVIQWFTTTSFRGDFRRSARRHFPTFRNPYSVQAPLYLW